MVTLDWELHGRTVTVMWLQALKTRPWRALEPSNTRVTSTLLDLITEGLVCQTNMLSDGMPYISQKTVFS